MGQPKVHEFKGSLRRGQKGEAEFFELFKDKLQRESGFIADFKILASGEGLELKTDFWCPTKTPNMVAERYSYSDVDGGPWQSLKKGIKYFAYWYPSCMQIHVWETATLVERLDKVCKDKYLIPIRNVSHITQIYKVERADVADIELDLMKVLNGKA